MATLYRRSLDPDAGSARIASLWWAMALRGVGAIVLALLAVLWPAITLLVLVLIFAAYCIVDAAFSIVLALRGAKRNARWWWPALHALVALATAAIAMAYPALTGVAFVAVLIAWTLLTGVTSIAAAFRLDDSHGRWWLIASGLVSMILAALLIAFPALSLLTLTWIIAFQSLTTGSLLLALAFRLRVKSATQSAGIAGAISVERSAP